MNNEKDDKPKKAFGGGKKESTIEINHQGVSEVINTPLTCGLDTDRVCLITSLLGEKQFFWGFMVGEVSRKQIDEFARSTSGMKYTESIQKSAVNPALACLKKAQVITLYSYLGIEDRLLALTERYPESSVLICNCATVEILDAAIEAVRSCDTVDAAAYSSPLMSSNQLLNSLKAAKNAF